ncbi:MAG: hypothetical protein Q9174_005743 [Haloplaca sp. 1 TL-2023]
MTRRCIKTPSLIMTVVSYRYQDLGWRLSHTVYFDSEDIVAEDVDCHDCHADTGKGTSPINEHVYKEEQNTLARAFPEYIDNSEIDTGAQDSSSCSVDGNNGTISDTVPTLQELPKDFMEAFEAVGIHPVDDLDESSEDEKCSHSNENAEKAVRQPLEPVQHELQSLEDLRAATSAAKKATQGITKPISSKEGIVPIQTTVDERPTHPLCVPSPAPLQVGPRQSNEPGSLPTPPRAKADDTGSELFDGLFKKYYNEFGISVPTQTSSRKRAVSRPMDAEEILSSTLSLRIQPHYAPRSTPAKALPPSTSHHEAIDTVASVPKQDNVRTQMTNREKLDAIINWLKHTSTAPNKAGEDPAYVQNSERAQDFPHSSPESIIWPESKQFLPTLNHESQGDLENNSLPSLSNRDQGLLGLLIDYDPAVTTFASLDKKQSLLRVEAGSEGAAGIPSEARPPIDLLGPLTADDSAKADETVARNDDQRLGDAMAIDEEPMDVDYEPLDAEEDTMDIDHEAAMVSWCPAVERIMAQDVPDIEMAMVPYIPEAEIAKMPFSQEVEMALVPYESEVEAAPVAISYEIEMSDSDDTSDDHDVDMSEVYDDSDTDMTSIDDEDGIDDDSMDCDF